MRLAKSCASVRQGEQPGQVAAEAVAVGGMQEQEVGPLGRREQCRQLHICGGARRQALRAFP